MTKRKLSAQCLQRLPVTVCICLFLTVANASESMTIINKVKIRPQRGRLWFNP